MLPGFLSWSCVGLFRPPQLLWVHWGSIPATSWRHHFPTVLLFLYIMCHHESSNAGPMCSYIFHQKRKFWEGSHRAKLVTLPGLKVLFFQAFSGCAASASCCPWKDSRSVEVKMDLGRFYYKPIRLSLHRLWNSNITIKKQGPGRDGTWPVRHREKGTLGRAAVTSQWAKLVAGSHQLTHMLLFAGSVGLTWAL